MTGAHAGESLTIQENVFVRKFFMGVIVSLLLLSVAACWLIPREAEDGRTTLVWTTDPNPQRLPQVEWFNTLYPDCRLQIDPDNTDAMKVIVQSCAGMGPDIVGRVYEGVLQSYHENGILMDLTEYADRMGFGLDTLPENVRPLVTLKVLMADGSIQDRMFTYPCNVSHHFVMYNKNVFDDAGVPYPAEDLTWEEYLDLSRKLTVMDKQRGVPRVFGAAGAIVDTIIYEHGAEYLNEQGTRCTMDSPEFVDAMLFYHRLFYELGAEPTPLQKAGVSSQGGWGGGYNNWFGEGKIGMLWGERWKLISFRRFMAEQHRAREAWLAENPGADPVGAPKVLRLGGCQIPRFKDGTRYTVTGARGAAINAAGPNREKALKFLQYLASEKYSQLINEGSDSKPANQKYHSLERFINPEWPGEEEVHAASLRALQFGRTRRRSMLVNSATLDAEFQQLKSKIEASPDLTREMIAAELKHAAGRVNLIIARNVSRNPKVRVMYDALLAHGAEPIVHTLEGVR